MDQVSIGSSKPVGCCNRIVGLANVANAKTNGDARWFCVDEVDRVAKWHGAFNHLQFGLSTTREIIKTLHAPAETLSAGQ